MTGLACEVVRELLPEVALDVADARDRAQVLAHTEICADCRRELAATVTVVEDLAALAPPAEPPAGFDQRVLAALGPTVDLRPSSSLPLDATPSASVPVAPVPAASPVLVATSAPVASPVPAATPASTRLGGLRRSRPLLALAAALVLLAGVAGWVIGHNGPSRPAPADVAAASLKAGPEVVGRVLLAGGVHPWLAMAVRSDPSWGTTAATAVRCQVETPDGTMVTVGTFALATQGYGYWSAAVPPGTVVVGARLVDPTGDVIAAATFPAVRL